MSKKNKENVIKSNGIQSSLDKTLSLDSSML